ncbi:MAG: TnsA endonuclease N-terminal domain-containing protein [Deferribacterales bacterium]
MATRFDEKTIQKRLAEGRGKGEYGNYKPWLTVRDVSSSKSRSNRPLGWKTGRPHQLLSDNEFKYFLYLEWAENVLDIREQFPLDREDTVRISKETGIKHPFMYETYQVLSTDFLILLDDGRFIARTFKEAKDLENRRNLEKLSIEQIYWQEKDVDWGIVTNNELDPVFVRNVSLLHGFRKTAEEINNPAALKRIIGLIRSSNCLISEILEETDAMLGLVHGTSLSLYKSAVANKIILMDMFKPFTINAYTEELIVVKDFMEHSA